MADRVRAGFIGLGVMGAPMSKRLLERGHALVVHDRDPAAVRRLATAGATAAASAREVADAAQTVFVSLPTPAIVREVALGGNGIVRGSAVRTFFAFGFPIASVCKDISLAVEEFQALGVPMWVGGAARQLWHYANA